MRDGTLETQLPRTFLEIVDRAGETDARLVEKQEVRREEEGERRVHLLARAARQHAQRLAKVVAQIQLRDELLVSRAVLSTKLTHRREQIGRAQVVGEPRDLRHVPDGLAVTSLGVYRIPVDCDRAGIDARETEDALDERGLSRAVRSRDRGHPSPRKGRFDAIQHLELAVALAHTT